MSQRDKWRAPAGDKGSTTSTMGPPLPAVGGRPRTSPRCYCARDLACALRLGSRAVSIPTVSLRPSAGRLAGLTLAATTIFGVLIAVLTSARASEIEPSPRAPFAAPEPAAVETPLPPSVMRTGYRLGRQQLIEVVPLGAVEVEVATARAFLSMQAAAAKDGIELRIESGFRTAEAQRDLFLAWRKGRGNKAARPGESNHQSGRALDLAVQSPGALEWLTTNAPAFRFKRTVKGEPWHWEFTDVPVARDPAAKIKKRKTSTVKKRRHTKK